MDTCASTQMPCQARFVIRAAVRAAAGVALCVALAVPATIGGLTWRAQVQDATTEARLHAAFVSQALGRSTDGWEFEVPGLLAESGLASVLPERRQVIGADGRIVAQHGAAMPAPVVMARAPLRVGDRTVGEMVLTRSLRPLLVDAWILSLACALAGAAIYAWLRRLPVRSLERALQALSEEQERHRRESQEQARLLFEQAVEGILVFDAAGTVQSCNASAAEMLGSTPAAVQGTPLSRWIELPPPAPQAPIAIGSMETHARRRAGGAAQAFPCELTVSALPPRDGAERYLAHLRDLTERRQAELRQAHLANFDSLTGLPNRSLFRERLAQAMARARRSGRLMALMFLDLDRFKQVNDSLGHVAGDTLLQHVARTLGQCLRQGGGEAQDAKIARLGGDEFTVLVEDVGGVRQVEAIARRILEALEVPLFIQGQEIVVTSSIGIALYPSEDCTLDELLRHADMAMYRAKDGGRNAFHVYSEAMHADAATRLRLEARLRHALERDEYRLHYQPKCSLADGSIGGVEALLRWYPKGSDDVVPPDQFISVLEETGLIVPVGRWVLEEALRQVAAWQAMGLPPLRVAVNLSARQLRQPDLPEIVADTLARSGIASDQLELELTESMLMAGDAVASTVGRIADLGVHLAIDDFGTGYSSLAYLKRFFVNSLKIDRSFVDEMPNNAEDVAIGSAIIALAHSLNLSVVAEGVETAAQAKFLRERGCDEMQGYLLSRAMPPDEFAAWWRARHRLRASVEEAALET